MTEERTDQAVEQSREENHVSYRPTSGSRRGAALIAIVGLVVAACGGGATPSPSSAASASPATSAAETAAASASGGKIGGSVSIVAVWSGGDDRMNASLAATLVLLSLLVGLAAFGVSQSKITPSATLEARRSGSAP